MTENKVLCPTCGSARINESFLGTYLARPCKHCISCGTLWQEEKRQPPLITPEMAYRWFCKKTFKEYALDKIYIDKYGDMHWVWPGNKIAGGLNHRMVNALGWSEMPPVTRGEVENETSDL